MIAGVRLQNFRSYRDQTFEFEPGINIVVGPNASGKTNLLEALYVSATGKSFRARDLDLIKHGQNWARLDIDESEGTKRTVKIQADKLPKKQFFISSLPKMRLAARDCLPVVLFVPDHLRLLTGSPENRRNYLDAMITQLFPAQKGLINRYQRTLLQRNNILKQPAVDADNLFVWSIKLGELGGKIAGLRMELINRLNNFGSKTYNMLAGGKHSIRFKYRSNLTTEPDKYAHLFNQKLQGHEDLMLGFTAHGPHRDDFLVELDGHDSSVTASRGETRTLVMVLKIIETKLIKQQFGIKPLILLDDIFSELDGKRRQQLAVSLSDHQTLITTTDADSVLEHFSSAGSIRTMSV